MDQEDCKTEYKVGDIVWAKLTGCPFWPSIVTYDPVTRLYFKGKNKTFTLHVRFCSYMGQRNWVKNIDKYSSIEELVSNHPSCKIPLKKNKQEMVAWHAAVKEADYLMTLKRKKRLLYFCNKYELNYFNEIGINSSSDYPAPQNNNLNSSGGFHDATPKELGINGSSDDRAPQNNNLNSSGGFCDATPILAKNNKNILNNDTTDASDHDASDHNAANRPTVSEQILNEIIGRYGICQNDPKDKINVEELDFDNLKQYQGTYRLPENLKQRISEFEKNQKQESRNKKK